MKTVDRFADEAGWVDFLVANRAAYDELDARLEHLTVDETELA